MSILTNFCSDCIFIPSTVFTVCIESASFLTLACTYNILLYILSFHNHGHSLPRNKHTDIVKYHKPYQESVEFAGMSNAGQCSYISRHARFRVFDLCGSTWKYII